MLIEAIGLGHDLGHVAFAHNGEEVLNEFLDGGFRHNEQSVRVVKKLEKDGKGLNLTEEVIDGILNHSGLPSSLPFSVTRAKCLVPSSGLYSYTLLASQYYWSENSKRFVHPQTLFANSAY